MIARHVPIIWTNYLKYRAEVRGYSLGKTEKIIRYSTERYFDTQTLRKVVIGRHDSRLVIIPYEETDRGIVPITVHVTTRQQINFRVKTGRFEQ